jgi:GNAT superfamily N-acetyltransferase
MPEPAGTAELSYRAASPDDAAAIAALHCDSWQRHYRGAYTDRFLDDQAPDFLLDLWTARMSGPDPRARTIVAELAEPGDRGAVVGLARTVVRDNGTWGALLDNLHVAYGLKGNGVGTRLMAMSAQAVLDEDPASGLYLWVFEQNAAARAFYEARGGRCVERLPAGAPGGDPAALSGRPYGLRMAWRDPSVLSRTRTAGA